MKAVIFALVTIVMVVAGWTATAHGDDPAPKLESLRLSETNWYCQNHDDFVKWIAASNKYGPILLEKGVIQKFKCSSEKLPLTNTKSIGFIKAFNLPVLMIEAESHLGTVYTFVPILQTLPFKEGIGA